MSEQVTWGSDGYAGFWRRAAGFLIDGIIFVALQVMVGLVFGVAVGVGGATDDTVGGVATALDWVFLALWFLYDTIMTSKLGWTVGKRAVNIEVRTADGHLPSYGLAVGRFFARILSGIPLLLGFFWAGWDAKKQTWHDKICSTYVIKRENIGAMQGTEDWATQPGWGAVDAPAQQGWGSTAQPDGWGPSGPEPQRQTGWGDAPQGSALGAAAGGAAAGGAMGSATWSTAGQPDEPRRAEGAEASGWEAGGSTSPSEEGQPVPAQDPNMVAIDRSGVGGDSADWIRQVAEQVDPRLDLVAPGWRSAAQADAARACAFGLLIGHLGRTYPHMEPDLGRVAESHPSFSTLLEGSRLSTLEQIAGDPGRATAWLGPLVDVSDPAQIRRLFD